MCLRAHDSPRPRVLGHEYHALRDTLDKGGRDMNNAYGTKNPAEFFAVVTEHFFEQGARLRDTHPDLYDLLQRYYRVDPVTWL
ncbi:MAG: Mlc titration factor MtfA (ptsG expression regulator) [Myxococcota bacterium]|jgi:Mlc titration factor MtfA (ptsG expression regulator)